MEFENHFESNSPNANVSHENSSQDSDENLAFDSDGNVVFSDFEETRVDFEKEEEKNPKKPTKFDLSAKATKLTRELNLSIEPRASSISSIKEFLNPTKKKFTISNNNENIEIEIIEKNHKNCRLKELIREQNKIKIQELSKPCKKSSTVENIHNIVPAKNHAVKRSGNQRVIDSDNESNASAAFNLAHKVVKLDENSDGFVDAKSLDCDSAYSYSEQEFDEFIKDSASGALQNHASNSKNEYYEPVIEESESGNDHNGYSNDVGSGLVQDYQASKKSLAEDFTEFENPCGLLSGDFKTQKSSNASKPKEFEFNSQVDHFLSGNFNSQVPLHECLTPKVLDSNSCEIASDGGVDQDVYGIAQSEELNSADSVSKAMNLDLNESQMSDILLTASITENSGTRTMHTQVTRTYIKNSTKEKVIEENSEFIDIENEKSTDADDESDGTDISDQESVVSKLVQLPIPKATPKQKREKSKFIETEAQESSDEFKGLGGSSHTSSSDSSLSKNSCDNVQYSSDDVKMLHLAHVQNDDQDDLKKVRDVIVGKRRQRYSKRVGLGFDSDSEDEADLLKYLRTRRLKDLGGDDDNANDNGGIKVTKEFMKSLIRFDSDDVLSSESSIDIHIGDLVKKLPRPKYVTKPVEKSTEVGTVDKQMEFDFESDVDVMGLLKKDIVEKVPTSRIVKKTKTSIISASDSRIKDDGKVVFDHKETASGLEYKCVQSEKTSGFLIGSAITKTKKSVKRGKEPEITGKGKLHLYL